MLTKGNTAVCDRRQLQTQRGEGPRRSGVCPCQPSPSAHGCHLRPSKITRCVSVCWLVLCGVQTTAALWGTDNSYFVGVQTTATLWGTDNSHFVGYRQQLLCGLHLQTTATFTLWGTYNSYFGGMDNSYFYFVGLGYRQQLLCRVWTTATWWGTDSSYFLGYRQQLLCGVQRTATFSLWGTDNSYFYFVGYRQQLLLLCGVRTPATLWGTDNSYFVGYRQQLLLF